MYLCCGLHRTPRWTLLPVPVTPGSTLYVYNGQKTSRNIVEETVDVHNNGVKLDNIKHHKENKYQPK